MRLRRHRAGPAADRRVVWQAASLLLAYPDEAFAQRLSLVDAALETLPPAAREPLRQCVSRLTALDPTDAAVKYVDTFDWRRRRTPFLTYYTAGDTRGRGMALLEFATVYRAAGAVPPPGELPDHLAVVLEFAATVDEEAGYRLLAAHRTPIDLLLDGLRKMDSPYASAVQAVAATLPPPSEQDLLTARRLIMQGPPAEAVGLDPYPMPGGGRPGPGRGPVDIAISPNPRTLAGKGMS
jgi:nitrate reductase delta subunit